jgi:hypothetical protein
VEYPPFLVGRFGKEYILNSRGIYFHRGPPGPTVMENRRLWIPSSSYIDPENQVDLRLRATRLADISVDNERWCKSEYAWDADAWHYVFGLMRRDPGIAM